MVQFKNYLWDLCEFVMAYDQLVEIWNICERERKGLKPTITQIELCDFYESADTLRKFLKMAVST